MLLVTGPLAPDIGSGQELTSATWSRSDTHMGISYSMNASWVIHLL